jgi:eukaryotic-like serine/threonine-protein kinase
MPLNPKRVQAVFWEAVQYPEPADWAAILDRECMGDPELRRRIEMLLKAHDRFNDFVNQPLDGAGGQNTWYYEMSDIPRSGTID